MDHPTNSPYSSPTLPPLSFSCSRSLPTPPPHSLSLLLARSLSRPRALPHLDVGYRRQQALANKDGEMHGVEVSRFKWCELRAQHGLPTVPTVRTMCTHLCRSPTAFGEFLPPARGQAPTRRHQPCSPGAFVPTLPCQAARTTSLCRS